MQASFAVGFLGIASDLVNILRVYLINPTYGSEKYQECPAARHEMLDREEKEAGWTSPKPRVPSLLGVSPLSDARSPGDFSGEPPEGTADNPRTRFSVRRLTGFMCLTFLAAFIPGTVVNLQYSTTASSQQSSRLMTLRYESTAIGVFLLLVMAVATVWGRVNLSRVSTKGTRILSVLCFLLSIVGIYRLSVMFHQKTSLTSRAPGSLNSPSAKAAFYILHILPEWIALVVIFGFNIRQTFGTGLAGYHRFRDEKPKQREKREKKEAKLAEKRRQKRLAAAAEEKRFVIA